MAEVELIAKWQQGISSEHDTEEQPLIARLYAACSELFSDLLTTLRRQPSIERSTIVSLERSHGYLVLWADGYGVKDGQLESMLDRSRRARQSTLRLLMSICQTLTRRLLPLIPRNRQAVFSSKSAEVEQAIDKLKYMIHHDDTYDSDSESSSETSSTSDISELEEIAEDLKTDTQCLLDMGSRFMEKAVGPVTDEKTLDLSQVIAWDPSNNFIDRIRWRYPCCDEKLAARLGKANWARIQRCQEMKDQNTRLGVAGQLPQDGTASVMTKPSTTFHDSGIGSSLPSAPTASQYAETIVSYRGGRGDSIRIPNLPDGAKAGDAFTCVACGKEVNITNKSAWKKHLFLDLQPYMCLADDCDFNGFPFATRGEWEDHLMLDHQQSDEQKWSACPICKEPIRNEKIHPATHLGRHLEEIALTILPTNPDSEDGTDIDGTSSQISPRFLPRIWIGQGLQNDGEDFEDSQKAINPASSGVGVEKDVEPRIDEPSNVDGAETTAINQPTQKTQGITGGLHDCTYIPCDRKFKRPTDLHKHEKTHGRPWKCPVPTCKYHEHGWPTEKDLGRHVNDKHAPQIAMYECEFKPCPYKSKRESNCKQHMEKAHGWIYVRTKNNGKSARPEPQPAVQQRSSGSLEAPTFSKAVHFDSDLETVRHFSRLDSPERVSLSDVGVGDSNPTPERRDIHESSGSNLSFSPEKVLNNYLSVVTNAAKNYGNTETLQDPQNEFVLFDTPRSPIHGVFPPPPSESEPVQSKEVRVTQERPKPQCWDHGCNGKTFSTFSNLLRHQRQKSGQGSKAVCAICGAEFARANERNAHLLNDDCQPP